MELRESETFKNLITAYKGELQACGKYQIYAKQARNEGYMHIGGIFEETSRNELHHAEIWKNVLNGGSMPETSRNLAKAHEDEKKEWSEMYENFAQKAEEEGFKGVARLFREVGEIERHHDYRFEQLTQDILTNHVFCKELEMVWICMNCGNIAFGDCAPIRCPVCGCPQGYYKLNCEDY